MFSGPPGVTIPVYADPYGAAQLTSLTTGQPLPLGGVIPRVQPGFLFSFFGGSALNDSLFALPDDVTFLSNGTADLSSGVVQRGLNYSYTCLLRPLRPRFSEQLIQMYVVVFSGRPVTALSLEPTYTAAGVAGSNSLTLTWPAGQPTPNVRRGGWLLDTTTDPKIGVPAANFYRVTNLVDTSSNSMVVELEQNLATAVNTITVMDYVVEVFDKGTSWAP
jgi:hypothetical protein